MSAQLSRQRRKNYLEQLEVENGRLKQAFRESERERETLAKRVSDLNDRLQKMQSRNSGKPLALGEAAPLSRSEDFAFSDLFNWSAASSSLLSDSVSYSLADQKYGVSPPHSPKFSTMTVGMVSRREPSQIDFGFGKLALFATIGSAIHTFMNPVLRHGHSPFVNPHSSTGVAKRNLSMFSRIFKMLRK